MKRRRGSTQKAILDTPEDAAGTFDMVTIASLANRLGVSQRQVRTAAKSLADQGLATYKPPQEAMIGLPG